ncbi:DUF1833 family protein [Noviherbaspirillum autotrophicum]|uniref:Uncharacterized protein n=1 Tax=Noviherbaspirillum autotrophicum TaxID=709839 RepID=A0A0C1YJU3_9BURK|nr:DUF1833 family protein [Noviherbaspirillum autotrophicum]KIF80772.1 hypothetical protein TSA66_07975 [Noviherbaspirillum autotrophicum]KIF80809.1 hypothetical protein TSA66_08220 [Noviherbaspirillum autotrophicum]KIF84034.1 hypothetical protein TSA66_00910 [Noviherbaspirillum autotrophicum]
MSLDLESRLKVFLASAPQTVWPIQTLEISHSAMSRTFHLWREPYPGTTYVDGVAMAMDPCNIEIKLAGSEGNLDQKFDIRIGLVDIEDVFRDELDRIPVATTEKIKIVYREYLSDDLTTPQATATLQAESISYAIGAASISAVAPRLNMTRTGEVYSPKDIPMLRGFL